MKILTLSALLVCGIGFGTGCVGEAETPNDGFSERGPLGKADAPGTCASPDGGDFCGGQSDGACWCDDQCDSFGDCCGDKQMTCDGVDPGVALCQSDEVCDLGEVCDHSVCLSNCAPGQICPAVCWGACAEPENCLTTDTCDPDPDFTLCNQDIDCDADEVCDMTGECMGECPEGLSCPAVCLGVCAPEPEPEPELCLTENDCGAGDLCDMSVCLSNCAPGMVCPAVCWGSCEPETQECPDVCGPVCAGEAEPPVPEGCPQPACNCMDSCAGNCGGSAGAGSCWCDDQCAQFGDCCDDFQAACE